MQIHVLQNGEQIGPYDEEQIRGMVVSCTISENDLGWHDGLTEWQPLNTILSLAAPAPTPPPLPIAPPPEQPKAPPPPKPTAPPSFLSSPSPSPVACPTCGNPKWRASDPCQVCASAFVAARSRVQQQPAPQMPKKVVIDKRGAWCPHCGNRNSYKSTGGVGCITLGILFISMIGILLIPFLPKTWHCRECGHTWK
jgi:hypothetical protein